MRKTINRCMLLACTLVGMLMLSACSAKPRMKPVSTPVYEELAVEKYGEGTVCTPNNEGSHALCISPVDNMAQLPSVNFFTYDIGKQAVGYESDMACSNVRWVDDFTLEIIRTTGIVQRDAGPAPDARLHLDVRTGELQPAANR